MKVGKNISYSSLHPKNSQYKVKWLELRNKHFWKTYYGKAFFSITFFVSLSKSFVHSIGLDTKTRFTAACLNITPSLMYNR